MNRLPQELFELIFSYLDIKEASQLRLVDSRLCQVANPYVFREISLYMIPFNIRQFHSFAHSELATHVRSITINARLLEKVEKRGFRRRSTNTIFSGYRYSPTREPSCEDERSVKDDLREYWAYMSYHYEQEGLLWQAKWRRLLREAFSALMLLNAVKMKCLVATYDSVYNSGVCRDTSRWKAGRRSIATFKSMLACLGLRDEHACDPLTACILAVLAQRSMLPHLTPIRAFSMHAPRKESLLSRRLLSPNFQKNDKEHQTLIDTIRQFLRSLDSFTITPGFSGCKEGFPMESITVEILELIGTCSNARDLSLSLNLPTDSNYLSLYHWSPQVTRTPSFPHRPLSTPLVWPKLQYLHLQYCYIRHKDMLPFLRAHAKGLIALQLEWCYVDQFIPFMRSVREILTDLRRISLHRISYRSMSNPRMEVRTYFWDRETLNSDVHQQLLAAEGRGYLAEHR